MRRLPLSALRAFAAVFETGGVRPAARALQVTHSAVSRHVRELEAKAGALRSLADSLDGIAARIDRERPE